MNESIELFGRTFPGWLVLALAVVFALTMVVLRVVLITWHTNKLLRERDRVND